MSDAANKELDQSQVKAFEVDSRVTLRMEPALAVLLGKLILETDTKNTAILAIGHQLRSLQNAKISI